MICENSLLLLLENSYKIQSLLLLYYYQNILLISNQMIGQDSQIVEATDGPSSAQSYLQLTHNQFKIKLDNFLSQMEYQGFLAAIDNIEPGQNIDEIDNLRKVSILCLKEHLRIFYDFNEQVQDDRKPGFDLDSFIQMVSKSISGLAQFQEDSQILELLVKRAINEDRKYAFIIFRSNSLIFGKGKGQSRQDAISQNVRYLKYLNSIVLFLQLIITSNQQHFFTDFLQLLRAPKNIFESLHENPDIAQTENRLAEIAPINNLYFHFSLRTIHQCNRIYQSSQIKLEIREKVLKVIQQSISLGIYFLEAEQKSLLIKQLNKAQSLFSFSANRFLAPIQPTIFIAHLVKTENLVALLPPKEYLFYLYILFLRITPANTLQSHLGTFIETISSFIVEVLNQVCKLLIFFHQKLAEQIEAEKIWVDSNCFVDLIALYSRIHIYSGFLSKENEECWMLIRELMRFSTRRYQECPLLPMRIWTKIISNSMPNEYNFRIHCITNIKKQLISLKPLLLSKKKEFQFHQFHSHSYLFIITGSSITQQIQILLKSQENRFHSDYCGHVISYVSNWLLCLRFWANNCGIEGDQCKKLMVNEEVRKVERKYSKLKMKVEQLYQKKKLVEGQNKEGISQYQLLLFQIKGIKFD